MTFGLPDDAQRRTVVLGVDDDGERVEVEFFDGTYTTDSQEVSDLLYKAGYNPVDQEVDARPPRPVIE